MRQQVRSTQCEALALDPNNAATWSNKGASLNALGRNDEAVAAYDRALALDPNNAVAWSNKGNALWRLKRYQEAVAAYDKALAIDPKYAQALRNKAISLRALGRIAEADEAERRAKALGGRGCCRPIDSDQLCRHLQPTLLQPAVADAARGMVYHRQLHDSPTSALG